MGISMNIILYLLRRLELGRIDGRQMKKMERLGRDGTGLRLQRGSESFKNFKTYPSCNVIFRNRCLANFLVIDWVTCDVRS